MRITAALMLKAPRPGTVKTRLAAEMGDQKAAAIYRALVEHQLREIPSHWGCAIHFAPPDAGDEMREWLVGKAPEETRFFPQCAGDLGARMEHALDTQLKEGAGAVVLLGGDCPELTSEFLSAIESPLADADGVIAPAYDGGYVLLALKRPCPALFGGISWSTSSVLAETLERAASEGLKLFQTRPCTDIDEAGDLVKTGPFGLPGQEVSWFSAPR